MAGRNAVTPIHALTELSQLVSAQTAAGVVLATTSVACAAVLLWRNWRRNEPGLTKWSAFATACGTVGGLCLAVDNLPRTTAAFLLLAATSVGALLIAAADRHRYVRAPDGRVVHDRWRIALSLAGHSWTQDKACRHFFITGDTGAGKTVGMDRLLNGLFERNPRFGGVVLANKGNEWHTLRRIAARFGREGDLVRLRVRAIEDAEKPIHRLNLTGDARFPHLTRARILVDTAAALNPKEEKSFFKNKGSVHIARGLELLDAIGRKPTPTNCYQLLTSTETLKDALKQLTEREPSDRNIQLAEHFETNFLKHQSLEQRAGEVGTSQNYLEYLGTPAVAEVFSSDEADTCSISDVDQGKILCIEVPQDYPTERQYVFTVMKLLLYRHALRRYHLPAHERYAHNLLVLFGDEFQNVITASFDGTSDFNVVDRLRDCLLMLVVSAQAFESLIPPQTRDQASVFALNLRNLIMFRAASEDDARRCAEALGKREVRRTTVTVHGDHTSHTHNTVEEYHVKPHMFRRLPDHTAYIKHCTNGFRKVRLPPLSLS